jgi:basic membrane protein A
MKIRALVISIALVAISLVGAPAQAANLTIGIAYDIGGRGDRSFNDAAAIGLDKAQKQFTFAVEQVVTDGSSADRARRVRSLIAKNCNPVIVVGSGYAATIQGLAVEFPNTQFAILNDASIDALNVTSLIFADTQGAFIAGFSAAMASKSGKVAMIANDDQADLYHDGFLAGVTESKKPVTAMVKYVDGSSVTATKLAMDAGADVIFVARPGSNTEVFAAIVARNTAKQKSKNFKQVGMITTEPDQYVTVTSKSKRFLYATVVKHVDKAMYDVISKAISGSQYLDAIDEVAGIYGHRYTVLGGGITFTTYLPALTSVTSEINKAAQTASKITR